MKGYFSAGFWSHSFQLMLGCRFVIWYGKYSAGLICGRQKERPAKQKQPPDSLWHGRGLCRGLFHFDPYSFYLSLSSGFCTVLYWLALEHLWPPNVFYCKLSNMNTNALINKTQACTLYLKITYSSRTNWNAIISRNWHLKIPGCQQFAGIC